MQLHCYWDEADDPRARCDLSYELLAGFLESEIQGSISVCREILQAIDSVVTGACDTWQETGNAYTLTLAPQGASIEAEFDEDAEPCRLALGDLRHAVAQWLGFLEGEDIPEVK